MNLPLLSMLFSYAIFGLEPGSDPSLEILTTFQPLYSFVAEITKETPGVSVINLAPKTEGPHDYNPYLQSHWHSFEAHVKRAQAIVTLRSLPLAPLCDLLYPLARSINIYIVELDPAQDGLPDVPKLLLISNPQDTLHGHENRTSEEKSPPNPHIWLSLSHAAILVDRLMHDIRALDPKHAKHYERNATHYKSKILALKSEFSEKFATLDLLEVATLTEGFPYLTFDMDIRVVDYILNPKNHGEITTRIASSHVKIVLAEEQPDPETLTAIQAGGASVVILSTLEEGWGNSDVLEPDGYLDGMRQNLQTLYDALSRNIR